MFSPASQLLNDWKTFFFLINSKQSQTGYE